MKRVVIVAMSAVLLAITSAQAGYDSGAIWNSKTKIQVLKNDLGAHGFSVFCGERKICDIELTTGQKWVAKEFKTGQEKEIVWLELKNIDTSGTNKTPVFGSNSWIRVSLKGEKPFPLVEFSLDLHFFDRDDWQKSLQPPAPLYYLRCTPASATMVYHGGTLIPTAKVEKYPLTRREMAGEWGIGVWSYAPAMAAWAVPSAGLWDHTSGLFVVYDFNLARLTEKNEKFIAVAYCAGAGSHTGEFFALVHPYQKRWTKLTYPEKPEIINSKFELLYSTNIKSDKDPNKFVLNYLYNEHQDILPYIPRMNDLSWINKEDGYTPAVGLPRTIDNARLISKSGTSGLQGTFVIPGAEMLGNTFISDAIRRAYSEKNKKEIDDVKTQLEYLMSNATWMEIDEDKCCAWQHPLTGSFKEQFGGNEASGVHHVSTFQIATAMLVVYANEGDTKYLPYIDGVYNWTKHFLFTRNGVPDLPWAMFCRVGTAAGENFLLNYRQIFKNDPVRSKNYDEAMQLSLMTLYKVMWFYLANPDQTNNIDPSFLNQAVNDCHWIGRVTWNECGFVLRSMIPIYCETGDPFLKYILRGALERYWIGFRSDGGITENVQVFGEYEERGLRTGGVDNLRYGANFRRYALPVENASIRVCVGEKAAIAFCKESPDYDIADYSYEQGDNFSFRLLNLRPDKEQKPIDVIASFPFRDLRGKKVYLNGKELPAERYEYNSATDGEDVYVWNVMPSDVIAIGELKAPKPFPEPELKYRKPLKEQFVNINGFECLNLYPACNTSLELRFEKPDNWFGFIPGEHFKSSIPFYLVDPNLNAGKCVVKDDSKNPAVIDVNRKAKALFLFFGIQKKEFKEGKSAGRATVYFSDGEKIQKDAIKILSADITDMMPLRTWDLYIFPIMLGRSRDVQKIFVNSGFLFAVTVAPPDVPEQYIAEVNDKLARIDRENKLRLEYEEKMKKGTALLFKSEYTAANDYAHTYLYVTDNEIEILRNSFLEYDVFIPLDSAAFCGGIDLVGGTLVNTRGKGIGTHPSGLLLDAKGKWHHKKIDLYGLDGKNFKQVVLAVDGIIHQKGIYRAFYRDIQITDGKGKILIDLFTNKKEIPCGEPGIHALKGMINWEVRIVPSSEVKNPAMEVREPRPVKEPAGIINPDFSFEKQRECWTFYEGEFTSEEAYSGRTGVDLSISTGQLSIVMTNYKASMSMAIKPDKTYSVSFMAKCTSDTGEIRTNLYAIGHDFPQVIVPLIADGKWHRYETNVVTRDFPTKADEARVFKKIPSVLPVLRLWTTKQAQSTFIDDVEVREKM